MSTESASSRLQEVRHRIEAAAAQAGRDASSVQLLAVSKTFPAEAVAELAACGQQAFGENYVQEGIGKIDALAGLRPAPCWHFIGPLQSNKTRDVASRFDWVHAIDRLHVAQRLSAQRPPTRDGQPLAPLQVCLQVNVSGEASKSGIDEAGLFSLAEAVATLPNLRLRGLMCIPAPALGLAEQRRPFARLRELLEALRSRGMDLDTLSMGMSGDLEAAVLEGSTIVRVGTALFGARPPRDATP